MSDIRFNQWLHQSGTGGITQVDGGHVGIGTTNPDVAVHSGNTKKINVGIVTANSIYAGNFYGSGANLTGITQTTINNNADNRLITGSGTANTLEGESNLTWNGQTFEAYNASGPSYIAAKSNTNSGDYGIVQVQSGSTVRGRLVSDASVDAFRLDTAGRASAPITFHTGSSYAERLRIDSNGMIGFGGVVPKTQNTFDAIEFGKTGFLGSQTGARTVEMASNAYYNSGWKYKENDVASQYYQYNGYHAFSSAVSGSADGAITFTERLRITSDGHIGFNRTNVTINDSSAQAAVVEPKRIVFNNDYSNNYTDGSLKLYLFMYGATRQGFTSGPAYDLQYHSSGNATHAKHSFFTQNTEKFRIAADGNLFLQPTNMGTGSLYPYMNVLNGQIKKYMQLKVLNSGQGTKFTFTGTDRTSALITIKVSHSWTASNTDNRHGSAIFAAKFFTNSSGSAGWGGITLIQSDGYSTGNFILSNESGFGYSIKVNNPLGDSGISFCYDIEVMSATNTSKHSLTSVTVV